MSFLNTPPRLTRSPSTAHLNGDVEFIKGFQSGEKLKQLVDLMLETKGGVTLKDRKRNLTTYKKVIVGKELVDWLVFEKALCATRSQAVILCNMLLQNKLLVSVKKKDEPFRDDSTVFYQLSEESVEKSLSSSSEDSNNFRICILGVEGSGKTSFISRFIKDEFSNDENANSFSDYNVYSEDWAIQDQPIKIELLDTPNPVGPEFESGLVKWNDWATGYIILFNTTSRASFDALPKLYNHVLKVRSFRLTPVLLVGTKSDLERTVSQEEAQTVAKLYRCRYIEISAKSGSNVEESVQTIVEEILKVNSTAKGPSNYKTGWLKMKKEDNSSKKLFFIATESGLRFYKQEPESLNDTAHMLGVIPMQGCSVGNSALSIRRRRPSDASAQLVNDTTARKKITRKNSDVVPMVEKMKIYLIDHNDTSYSLTTNSLQERDEWFEHLSTCCDRANMNKSTKVGESPSDERLMTVEGVKEHGINSFNRNPKKGMKYLLEQGCLESSSPDTIASFLINEKKLKKQSVGQYLGEAQNEPVLSAYTNRFDFSQVEFSEALRNFLLHFRLPGEAQMIDRIMSAFASRYCSCNIGAFETPDIGYILAFSLIMLNTDAHNPSVPVERKMKKDQFVYNLRGINAGNDLDVNLLEKLYDDIKKKPLEMEYERDEFVQWDKQGFVNVKESKVKDINLSNKKIKGRSLWCIISAGVLYLFEKPQEKKPMFIIPLSNLQIDSLIESEESSGFVLYNPDPNSYVRCAVQGSTEEKFKEFVFHWDNRKTKYEWMLTFKLNLVSAPNYK